MVALFWRVKKMGYEIGDKVIYISPFNKPMIGKVVYNVSNNYLIDLSNNTRQWITDRELIKYTEKQDYLNIVKKYLIGGKCKCIKNYTLKLYAQGLGYWKETIPVNTEFIIDAFHSSLVPDAFGGIITVNYVDLRPDTWQPNFNTTIIDGTVNIVWERFAEYFELLK